MNEFKGAVAVITGAASGIGRALADHCAQEDMRVVLADIEEDALARTEKEMTAKGATVLAVATDVASFSDVETLAAKALDTFGAVHLLCNNAGVCTPTAPIWENSLNDWKWVMGVNLWGVIHGIRAFVPIMLEQGAECHIVNTASSAGVTSLPSWAPYAATKHAIVALSETLCLQLVEREAKIGVSVLCPGFVRTRFGHANRNRPADLQNPGAEEETLSAEILEGLAAGMSPDAIADQVFDAIRDESFYILTHPDTELEVEMRMQNILQRRKPRLAPISN